MIDHRAALWSALLAMDQPAFERALFEVGDPERAEAIALDLFLALPPEQAGWWTTAHRGRSVADDAARLIRERLGEAPP